MQISDDFIVVFIEVYNIITSDPRLQLESDVIIYLVLSSIVVVMALAVLLVVFVVMLVILLLLLVVFLLLLAPPLVLLFVVLVVLVVMLVILGIDISATVMAVVTAAIAVCRHVVQPESIAGQDIMYVSVGIKAEISVLAHYIHCRTPGIGQWGYYGDRRNHEADQRRLDGMSSHGLTVLIYNKTHHPLPRFRTYRETASPRQRIPIG